jgi:hypothetical protein
MRFILPDFADGTAAAWDAGVVAISLKVLH